MKRILDNLKHTADLILQNNTATRGRPLGFQIAVVTLFTVDVIAFITFFILKLTSQ